jgi:transposase-like protein
VDLPCTDIQIDEIWSFIGCKERNKETTKLKEGGDVWTWTTICRDTKLTPSWLVADRGQGAAHELMADLASRVARDVQISADGHRAYIYAVKRAFGRDANSAAS